MIIQVLGICLMSHPNTSAPIPAPEPGRDGMGKQETGFLLRLWLKNEDLKIFFEIVNSPKSEYGSTLAYIYKKSS